MTSLNEKILEVRANKFRSKLGFGTDEPIDLYKISIELNVLVNFRPLSEAFSGMALKTGKGCFILVNSNQTRARQHFTIGHELYHLYEQPGFEFKICDVGRFNKKDREEYNADVFSSFLLMPEPGILNCIPETELGRGADISLSTIVKLEQYFGVSRSALLVRLDKLGLINYNHYKEHYQTGIKASAHALGYSTRLNEKGSDYNIISDYGELCKNLFEKDKISESHYFNLMNDIGVNIDEKFEENVDEW